ncbi:hypothetical protein [Ruegeria sp. ANG-R]|uniref:hypothetical protein n=1 Tax=Ruegeria sp. ANG-R TaxID=1577903 RepID=UPI001269C426|nr:hypothetical protein [Ruegeria sp. ANG-R]
MIDLADEFPEIGAQVGSRGLGRRCLEYHLSRTSTEQYSLKSVKNCTETVVRTIVAVRNEYRRSNESYQHVLQQLKLQDWHHVSDDETALDMKKCGKKAGLTANSFPESQHVRSLFQSDPTELEKLREKVDVFRFVPIPGVCIVLTKLGWPTNVYHTIGIDAVLPAEADGLWFWYTSHPNFVAGAKIVQTFGESFWATRTCRGLSYPTVEKRHWARTFLGVYRHRLGPQAEEELFFSSGFCFDDGDEMPLKLTKNGTYIHYHEL